MRHEAPPHDQNARLESLLLDIQRKLDIQAITIAQIQDELADSRRRDEWYHVQFSQMLRILARDTRELRATLICSLLSEGPVSAKTIQALLRRANEQPAAETAPAPIRN
jgi:hypothetical protein